MTTEDDFQKHLDENPEDHHTRLVFADWLEENNERWFGQNLRVWAKLRPALAAVPHLAHSLAGLRTDLHPLVRYAARHEFCRRTLTGLFAAGAYGHHEGMEPVRNLHREIDEELYFAELWALDPYERYDNGTTRMFGRTACAQSRLWCGSFEMAAHMLAYLYDSFDDDRSTVQLDRTAPEMMVLYASYAKGYVWPQGGTVGEDGSFMHLAAIYEAAARVDVSDLLAAVDAV